MTGALNLPTDGLTVGTNEFIVSGGNVGIGTATPATKLNVYDSSTNVTITGSGAGGVPTTYRWARSDGPDYWNVDFDNRNIGINGLAYWYFDGTSWSDRFHLYNNGGIILGAGPWTSSTWTEVYSNSANAALSVWQTGSGPQLTVGNYSLSVTPNLIVTNTGNVGIGTITPQAALDINGLVRLPAQPAATTPACAVTNDGAIALTHAHILCVCNGAGWVSTADGATACVF